MPVARDAWLGAFAASVGVEPPSAEEADALLELASLAAHASERTAAPITCWLAARAGITPSDAVELARSLVPPT